MRRLNARPWHGAFAALVAGLILTAWLETKATLAGNLARAAQENAISAIARLEASRTARRLTAITADIQRLGRGRISEPQARAMAESMWRLRTPEVSPDLVLRLIERESRFNPRARGQQGEIGLCQVKPSTVGIPASELEDPARNVEAGILHLRALVEQTGEVGLALAAWNAGLYAAPVRYARAVMGD